MRNIVLMIVLLLFTAAHEICGQDLTFLRGVVLDQKSGLSLPGALLTVEPGRISTVTDAEGSFTLELPSGDFELTVQFMGYETFKLGVSSPRIEPLRIRLVSLELGLDEVEVLATGYQEIPKSRASGSFVSVDRELITRRVSTNLIDRLEDVTSGLILNRSGDVGRG